MTQEYTAEQLSKILFDTARAKAILANQNAVAIIIFLVVH